MPLYLIKRRLLRLAKESLRAMRATKGRAVLMMLGVIIGIASLTVIVSIGEATKLEMLNLMTSFGFGVDALYVRAGGGRFFHRRVGGNPRNLTMADAEAIARFEYVREVVPQQVKGGIVIIHRNRKKQTVMFGVLSNWAVSRNWAISLGRFISDSDVEKIKKVCVLGEAVREKLFGDENPVGKWVRIRRAYYKVVGLMKSQGVLRSGHNLDDRIFVPLSVSSKLVLHHSSLSGFRVNLISTKYLETAIEDFKILLRKRHKLQPGEPDDFTIITSKQILDIVTRQTRSLTRMLAWIAGISLFVSGIVIMNIMLVAVTERKEEIGIRRAVGATRIDILYQFLGESVFVAILGGIFGLVSGYSIFRLISVFFNIPSLMSWKSFVLATFFSTFTGLVSGVFPAWKASQLTPLEAMK
ncbi:MAG: hypothetical protein DRG83_21390 [Deltaproteobacteria bacterium]|nr:MAG: hypothetical protein DRG83_21390 [Deltaproteobacteria bacterium]